MKHDPSLVSQRMWSLPQLPHYHGYAHTTGWFGASCFHNKSSCHFLLQLQLDPHTLPQGKGITDPLAEQLPTNFLPASLWVTSLPAARNAPKTPVLLRPEWGCPRGRHTPGGWYRPALLRLGWGIGRIVLAAGWGREEGRGSVLHSGARFIHQPSAHLSDVPAHHLPYCHFPGWDKNGNGAQEGTREDKFSTGL